VDGWSAAPSAAPPAASARLLEWRDLVTDAAAPIDSRIEAALAMGADAAGGALLLQLAAEKRIAYQLREAIGSVIFSNPDRSIRAAAARYFPRPGGAQAMRVPDVAKLQGDARRGQTRFLVSCATCHRVDGAGADIGPDLTEVHRKFDRGGLLDAIVRPDAAIAFGFEAALFVTREHQPYLGFLRADGATISIRDGHGMSVTLDRDALAARVPLESSLMPDPLALGLSEQDVADVVAYLMAR
jgi:putative heme-binding domain-containing protein